MREILLILSAIDAMKQDRSTNPIEDYENNDLSISKFWANLPDKIESQQSYSTSERC